MTSQSKTSFVQTLNELAECIPTYRREIFKTIVLGLLIGRGSKSVAGIYRIFSATLSMIITQKRFYGFMQSSNIPWPARW